MKRRNFLGCVSVLGLGLPTLPLLSLPNTKKRTQTFIPTGFARIDAVTKVFVPGSLTIITGRPSIGKTFVLLNLARNIAVKQDKRVGIFSMEMSREAIMSRLLTLETQIQFKDLRRGEIMKEQWPKIIHGAAKLSEKAIFLSDDYRLTLENIEATLEKKIVDIIFIDYLQLMHSSQQHSSLLEVIKSNVSSLSVLAKKYNIPIVVTSQISRDFEQRHNLSPELFKRHVDWKEISPLVENVITLYREGYYDIETPDNTMEFIFLKNSYGPKERLRLGWNPITGIICGRS